MLESYFPVNMMPTPMRYKGRPSGRPGLEFCVSRQSGQAGASGQDCSRTAKSLADLLSQSM